MVFLFSIRGSTDQSEIPKTYLQMRAPIFYNLLTQRTHSKGVIPISYRVHMTLKAELGVSWFFRLYSSLSSSPHKPPITDI